MKQLFRTSILFISLVVAVLYAQESEWVITEGQWSGANITPEEGRRFALEDARTEAIRSIVGISVTEETYRKLSESVKGDERQFYDVFGRLSKSNSSGRIIKEELLKDWIEIHYDLPVYKVRIKALVQEELGTVDPTFSIIMTVPKDVYYADTNEGEELDFRIIATEDCFIYLFNIMDNDSVQILLPNPFIKNNSFYVDRKEQVYEEMLKGLSFNVSLPQNKRISVEALYAVATKERYDFHIGDFDEKFGRIVLPYQTAIINIEKWLIKIPMSQRTETIKHYEIRRR